MYEPVAIVGFGLRTPGAGTAAEFWDGLIAGRESLTRFTPAELAEAGIEAGPGYVPVRGVLPHVTDFDIGLFGMTPFEAQITDPQHRVFLECAYEALENAGYLGETPHRIGIYAGAGNDSYLARNVWPHADVVERAGQLALQIAHDKDHLATRVAYRLGLTGPAMSVQTACSTSLVAVHLAARTLGLGEADVMLAGGVSIELPQVAGYTYQEHDILSPDGHCRAFDAAARGTVPANGAAVVVLKRLADAQRDGDTIHAVIRGSAVNNDGARKAGYAAPSVQGQAALDNARLDPGAVSYIETHGTATEIGDAIEVTALRSVFRDAAGVRVLGALKPNIGHLDTAAGVAGLIKAALALRHRSLPPTINFRTPNPELDLDDGRFRINTSPVRWTGESLVCGVSSFGIGGTNAHVILSSPPARDRRPALLPAVVPVSAHTASAAATSVALLAEALAGPSTSDLADVATTWQRGRPALSYRAAAITAAIDPPSPAAFGAPARRLRAASPVFLFTGTSNRFAGAATGLADRFDAFGEALTECEAAFGRPLGEAIREGVGPQPLPVAQSAVFGLQYATARLLRSFGVQPIALLGHSLGEYAAGCHAGALSLADAARLVTVRATLAGALPGRMIAVAATLDEVSPLLGDDLHVSAINGPRSLAVAGPEPALAELGRRLDQAGLRSRRVQVDAAYHSPLMDAIAEEFRAVVDDVEHRPLTVPLVSTVTGEIIPAGTTLSGDYWMRHLRSTVLFARAGELLLGSVRGLVPLEIGPGVTLSHLLAGLPGKSGAPPIAVLPGAAGELDPVQALLRAVADAWCAGISVDWGAPGLDSRGGRVPLPTYPFERTRQWIDPPDVDPRPTIAAPEAAAASEPGPAPDASTVNGRGEVAGGDDDEVRAALLGVWRDLLGVAEIGPEETFFSLGGQSIMVVRMIAEIRRRWGVTVPMADVLRDSSAPGLTETVQRLRRVAAPT
jgi:acyl transferase domain-containing protein